MIPATLSGMKALIQKLTRTSSSLSCSAGTGSGAGAGPPLAPTQHCTSFGPGQRPLTKVPPEQADPGLLRHVPACPLSLVHDFLMQHLTPTGSSGQAFVTVNPGGD